MKVLITGGAGYIGTELVKKLVKIPKVKEITKANKTSGFEGNQQILSFIKDLYSDYNIYNNYIALFDKTFTSPLSTTGIDVYNYVLRDSAYIDKKWCYNIVF